MEAQAAFSLAYLPMKISLLSMETAVLPAYLGSVLRGVLGQALRRDPGALAYLYTRRAAGGSRQDGVHPYVIVPPPMHPTTYHAGEELCFELYLLGDAARYCSPVVHALRGMQPFGLGAFRCSFSLRKVTHSLDQRVIWQDGVFHEIAAQSAALPYRSLQNIRQVLLRTRTPLRIRRDGVLLERVDFPTIIRNITRRMEAIAAQYGGFVDQKEVERIQALSAEISVVQNHLEMRRLARYSSRLDEKMDFSGLMGLMRFEGELSPFVPWLYGAQTLHIGRNTTFGMGRVEVEFL